MGGEPGHSHGHGMYQCNGEPLMKDGGSWIGHFFPGLVFFIWGLHWLQGTYRAYFASLRTKGVEYRARTTYTLWRFPECSESVLKTIFPLLAISLELYWAHKGGYRNLMCPADTERYGHFDGRHMGNWQHAAMYPAFVVAGIVDLVGYNVELPAGLQQVFLALAFACEGVLMALHKKHTPLDVMVHELLMYAMLSNAGAVLLEAIFPRNFLVSCARIGTTFMQCGWFWAATRMMFEDRPAWDDMDGQDMAPTMVAPVFFVGLIVVVTLSMFILYLCFHCYYQLVDARTAHYERVADGRAAPHERAGLLDEEQPEQLHRKAAGVSAVPLSTLSSK